MPGNPFKRRVLADIETAGGWDAILDRIASGETITDIAPTYQCSRNFLSMLLHDDPERSKLVYELRTKAADALAEQAKKVLDDVNVTTPFAREEIAKARAQADVRLWLAGRYNREMYGEKKEAVNVQINVAELHVDAFRQVPAAPAVPALPAPAEIVEVVE